MFFSPKYDEDVIIKSTKIYESVSKDGILLLLADDTDDSVYIRAIIEVITSKSPYAKGLKLCNFYITR